MRPQAGTVYEDTAAGQAAASEAAQQPNLSIAVKSESDQTACLPQPTSMPCSSSLATAPVAPSVPTPILTSLSTTVTIRTPTATPEHVWSRAHTEVIVLDGAGEETSPGVAPDQAMPKRSSLPARGTKRTRSARSRQENSSTER